MRIEIINFLKNNKSSSMPMWLKRTQPDLLKWILDETKNYQAKNIMERVYIILNGEPLKCSDNNYRVFNTFEKGYRLGCNLSHKCSDVINNRIENQKIVLLEKYGVDNPSKIPKSKEKTKQTNLKKYGYEHHNQNPEINTKTVLARKSRSAKEKVSEQDKRKQTNLNKYGVEHHMMLSNQQQKVQETNIHRLGVAFPLQHVNALTKMKETSKLLDRKLINKKTKTTLYDKYGVTAASRINLSKNTLEILDDEDLFKSFVLGKERKTVLDELNIAEHTLYLYAKKYQASYLFIRPLISSFEIEVAEFLDSLKIVYEQNNRTILKPKELDFYLSEHNIAIECCGIYWHSEISSGKDKNYHYNKYKACKDMNIQLITIFDDEWNNNTDIVKQLLVNKIVSSKSIFARKCKVVECTTAQAKEFINKCHIQQYVSSKVKLSLVYENKIVAVMTFGKSRYSNTNEWEILRYCSENKIAGGASKLLNYFINHYEPCSIVSYSDNRYFSGSVYEQMGFTKTSETVGYYYTDYHKRYNRLQFQKHKLVKEGYDSSLSEWEIMQSKKYDRIWDCGQISWVKTINDK
jgi:hypothetical protein